MHYHVPAQCALITRARLMRITDTGTTSVPITLLEPKAGPEGRALRMEMIQEQGQAHNPSRTLFYRMPKSSVKRWARPRSPSTPSLPLVYNVVAWALPVMMLIQSEAAAVMVTSALSGAP